MIALIHGASSSKIPMLVLRLAAPLYLSHLSQMVLAMTICEICPPGEVEMMISVLLNIFDSRSSLLNLIKLMIEREVAQTGELNFESDRRS